MNKLPSVSVIGCGFVGSAIIKGMNLFCDIKSYDKDPKKCVNSLQECLQSEFIFVCLPTPMECVEGGNCNLSIIEAFFKQVNDLIGFSETFSQHIFIIKSTVPIGTVKKLSNLYPNLSIVHSPEFLTARSAAIDFITPARNVVGADNPAIGERVINLYKYRFPGVPVYLMSSQESEMVKYFVNTFLTTKVLFFNEMKLLADKLNLSWDTVLDGVMADGRIAKTHYQVPGWDGSPGVGGACFAKDINALISTFQEEGIDPKILAAVWEQNKAVRPRDKWDWEKISSAVQSKSRQLNLNLG